MKKYKLSFKQALKALAKGKIIERRVNPEEDDVLLVRVRLAEKGIEAKHLRDFRHYSLGDLEWSDWEDFDTWRWDEEDYKAKYRIVKDYD